MVLITNTLNIYLMRVCVCVESCHEQFIMLISVFFDRLLIYRCTCYVSAVLCSAGVNTNQKYSHQWHSNWTIHWAWLRLDSIAWLWMRVYRPNIWNKKKSTTQRETMTLNTRKSSKKYGFLLQKIKIFKPTRQISWSQNYLNKFYWKFNAITYILHNIKKMIKNLND